MHESKHLPWLVVMVMAIAGLGSWACGSDAASKLDGGPGGVPGRGGATTTAVGGNAAGGATAAGGVSGGSGGATSIDAAIGSGGVGQSGGHTGSGGKTGSGGSYLDGGSGGKTGSSGSYLDGGSGGRAGSGGSYLDGGSGGKTGSGGRTGAGGRTGIDAAPNAMCGGLMGASCLADQFCDYLDHCGMITDSAGHCVPAGPGVICGAVYAPVCGCDGKTYTNDCERGAARAQKFSDGPCAPGRDASASTDRNAGVAWQAAAIGSSAGPGIIVMGRGFYAAATDTPYGSPSRLISDDTPSASLSNAQLDDLFARLAAIDLSALPHATSGTATCEATLLVSGCTSCARQTLSYSSAAQLAPEMEPVWAWFDEVLGSPTVATNPRTYCGSDGLPSSP